jgi:hypothetical protein
MNAILRAALALAKRGIPVFPCAGSKKPIVPNGFLSASTDPTIVTALFATRGAELIGVPTGEASGVDVLDMDYRHGAGAWEDQHGARLPETRTHLTPSGGRHLLFRTDPRVRNSQGRIALGVDVRGNGGYVCVPPIGGYRVISDADVAPWPDWLLVPGLVLQKPQVKPEVSGPYQPASNRRMEGYRRHVLARVSRAVDGRKHTELVAAGLLLGGIADEAGFGEDEAVSWLIAALPASAKDLVNAEKTAKWAFAAGREKPIQLEDRWRDEEVSPQPPPPQAPAARPILPQHVSGFIARTLVRLGQAKETDRLRALSTAAYTIGGVIDTASHTDATRILLDVAADWPELPPTEALPVITRGLFRGQLRPLTVGGQADGR